jgi:hypothetical protein
MIGYGPEDEQFVLELTYNYTVPEYELGNDFRHIVISSKQAYARAASLPDAQAAPAAEGGTGPGELVAHIQPGVSMTQDGIHECGRGSGGVLN